MIVSQTKAEIEPIFVKDIYCYAIAINFVYVINLINVYAN